jgi:peptide deformylase
MKLPLAYFGDAVLRRKASPVLQINQEIKELVENMRDTLVASGNGIGLSAPQVHRSLRLFITHVPVEDENGESNPGVFRVFINPKIISISEDVWIRDEGCLSIPGLYGQVIRPCTVVVEAQDLEGKLFTEAFTGLEGRCILHENDHINGVLFIDRIRGRERELLEEPLKKIKKKYHQAS